MPDIYLADKEIRFIKTTKENASAETIFIEKGNLWPFWDYFVTFLKAEPGKVLMLGAEDDKWLFRYVATFFEPVEVAGGLVKNDLTRLTPKTIALAARRGDELACEIFDTMADCLAAAFASVTYLLQPEVIIVGGGVAQSGRVLFEPLRRHLRERLHPFFAGRIRVIPAVLGADAGIIGCAALAFAAPSDTKDGG